MRRCSRKSLYPSIADNSRCTFVPRVKGRTKAMCVQDAGSSICKRAYISNKFNKVTQRRNLVSYGSGLIKTHVLGSITLPKTMRIILLNYVCEIAYWET